MKSILLNINNILLFIIFACISFGTLLPVAFDYFFNQKLIIGMSFFNELLAPIGICLLYMIIVSLIPIKVLRNDYQLIKISYFIVGIFLSFSYFYLTILCNEEKLIYFFKYNFIGFMYILFFFIGFNIFIYIIFFLKNRINRKKLLIILIHSSAILILFGIIISNIWNLETIRLINIGDQISLFNYKYILKSIDNIILLNYNSLFSDFLIQNLNDNTYITNLVAEKRFYFIKNIFLSKEAAIANYLNDFSIIITTGNYKNGWLVNLFYKPGTSIIWIATILILSFQFIYYNYIFYIEKIKNTN